MELELGTSKRKQQVHFRCFAVFIFGFDGRFHLSILDVKLDTPTIITFTHKGYFVCEGGRKNVSLVTKMCLSMYLQALFLVTLLVAAQGNQAILILGDWGVPDNPVHDIAQVARDNDINQIISVGDNFYEYGVNSVDDHLWEEVFENVYTDPVFSHTWNVIAGNHDHRGSVPAQISYTQSSSRWFFPSYYYKKTFYNDLVEIFFIDTQRLIHHHDQEQYNWLKLNLQKSTAKCKIVVGHHPIWSTGPHGSSTMLIDYIEPLLKKHSVKIYISGHDHGFNHLKDGSLNHIIVGNTGKSTEMGVNRVSPQIMFEWPDSSDYRGYSKSYRKGFAIFHVFPTGIAVEFYQTATRKVLYGTFVEY